MNLNLLDILPEPGDKWMNEEEILGISKSRISVVDQLLETLVHHKLVDYRVDDQFVESYQLTAEGVAQRDSCREQKRSSSFPPQSWGVAPEA